MIFDDFCQVWIVRLALLPLANSMLWVMLANLGCSICMRLRLQRRILNHPGAGTHQIDPALNQRFLGRVVYLIYILIFGGRDYSILWLCAVVAVVAVVSSPWNSTR